MRSLALAVPCCVRTSSAVIQADFVPCVATPPGGAASTTRVPVHVDWLNIGDAGTAAVPEQILLPPFRTCADAGLFASTT